MHNLTNWEMMPPIVQPSEITWVQHWLGLRFRVLGVHCEQPMSEYAADERARAERANGCTGGGSLLGGAPIVPRCPIARLSVEYYQFEPYTPKGIPEARASSVHIHCGYLEEKSKHCGFHIYNKNRLIRMYQRFGAQLQANVIMKDMLGVVEADCLEPTHNKQAFNTTEIAYAKCQKHIEKSMNDYYFGVQNLRLAGTAGRKIAHPGRAKSKVVKGAKGGRAAKGGAKAKGAVKGKRKGRDSDNEETDTDDEDGWGNDGVGRKKIKLSAPARRPKVDPFPRILRKLMNHKSSWAFNEPVDAEYWGVLDYYEIIKTPMDFGTIVTQLDAGAYRSENSGHGPLRFVTDVRQVRGQLTGYSGTGDRRFGERGFSNRGQGIRGQGTGDLVTGDKGFGGS